MELGQHIEADEMEAYLLRNVDEPQKGWIEEHLLWCQECIDRAEATERFIARVRAGIVRGGFEVELLAEEYRPKGRS